MLVTKLLLSWTKKCAMCFRTQTSGQIIIIFHQRGFPWNKRISLPQLPLGVPCEVAIIWPEKSHPRVPIGNASPLKAKWLPLADSSPSTDNVSTAVASRRRKLWWLWFFTWKPTAEALARRNWLQPQSVKKNSVTRKLANFHSSIGKFWESLCTCMVVSKNKGTTKSSILIGFSLINHPFWGTIIFGNTRIYINYPWKTTTKLPTKHTAIFFWGHRAHPPLITTAGGKAIPTAWPD